MVYIYYGSNKLVRRRPTSYRNNGMNGDQKIESFTLPKPNSVYNIYSLKQIRCIKARSLPTRSKLETFESVNSSAP